MLETVCGAVRILYKISTCACECDYYYFYYLSNFSQTHASFCTGRLSYTLFLTLPLLCHLQIDQFLENLVTYDKDNIHENCRKAVQPYLADPEFEPEFIRAKSFAAAGLCAWVINIIGYYEVFCDVEPKRMALAQANTDLNNARDKLKAIKSKVRDTSQKESVALVKSEHDWSSGTRAQFIASAALTRQIYFDYERAGGTIAPTSLPY